MLNHAARWIVRLRWPIIVFWIALTAVTMLWFPKLQTVVSHQSTTFLPNGSAAVTAQNLANQIDPKYKSKSTVVVAVRDPNGLTATDKAFFSHALANIDQHRSAFQANYVQDAGNMPSDVVKRMFSSDGTTEIATIGLSTDISDPNLAGTLSRLKAAFSNAPAGSRIYFTGDVPIQEDDIQLSQAGADKTALVTVGLVLLILLIVFRSVVTPFVTLFSIGLSYLISSGVVAFAAEHGLPVSTFTQTFLVAVLFGAGTDYSIILLNRFREELTRTHDRTEALAYALRGVGKTVIFSSLTVLVSFAVLYFAKFGLYRSAAGVSLGIVITLLVCLTFIPALMSIGGGGLYWPRKPKPGMDHRPSRIWGFTSGLSTRHPWWVLLALIVVLLPIALLFSNDRTFDPMQDIPSAPSVQGFHAVSNAFGPGRAMPVTVVLKTTDNLRSQKGLTTIQNVTRSLAALPNVKEVDSATQPLGSPEQGFQLAYQNGQAAAGLGKASDGLTTLANQLQSGSRQAGQAGPALQQLQAGSSQVTSGASQLANGASAIAQSSGQLASGANGLSSGAASVANGIGGIQSGMTQAQQGAASLAQGAAAANQSAQQLSQAAAGLASSEQGLAGTSNGLANALAAYAAENPPDPNNAQQVADWNSIVALAAQLQQGTSAAADSSQQLAAGMSGLAGAMPGLQSGAESLATATSQMGSGLTQLQGGAQQVASGASSLASGASQLDGGVHRLADGAKGLASGSWQVTNAIAQFQNSIGPMASGLAQAAAGAGKLSSGVGDVQSFLSQSQQADQKGSPGFYVPADTLASNSGLAQAMDAYISPDGHIAKWTVVLNQNPYAMQAMSDVPTISRAAASGLAVSPLPHGQFYLGGTTPTQAEINQLSTADFLRTMVIIFCTIFLLLVVMLRSILAPLYIMMSLAATYFVTMGIVQMVTIHILHHSGISWAVPFFVFLLLVALGVDYSIFLMSRFDESVKSGVHPLEAMRQSMAQMGNVVFSAAVIMMGTFGSLTVTGITTTTEIGLSVIIGLLLYAVVLLAFFVPAAAAVFGIAHNWPFGSRFRQRDRDGHDTGLAHSGWRTVEY